MAVVVEIKRKKLKSDRKAVEIRSKIRHLRSMLDDDRTEQVETFEFLKTALDEDRPSNRRLFK